MQTLSRPGASLIIILSFLLAACTADGRLTRGGAGAATGAAAGGLIGAAAGGSPAAIAAGVLLGGLAGGAIGEALDQRDRQLMIAAQQRSLETAQTGTTSTWVNPDSGHRGSVTPTRTYQIPSGEYCREFTQTIIVGGREEEGYGTACRQPDGSWRIRS